MFEKKIQIKDNIMSDEVLSFINVAEECIQLYAKKNHDYGNSFDKGMTDIGFSYGVGRIYDKVNRLINLSNGKELQLKNESIEDTLLDLACYSIMLKAYINKITNNVK